MKKPMLKLAAILVAASLSMGAFVAQAAKPFAKYKVVLQISDPNPFKQTLVLNVASNLVKHYGEDDVDVEIVAFGPGLRLLMDGNANGGRIDGLAQKGVRFSACANTIRNFGSKLGEDPKMDKHATVVPGGIVQIIELVQQGFILVKP
jgi:intracellular sulfur oxidation DsrE/DsrF family protein